MSLYGSKQVPKWRSSIGKKNLNFLKSKIFPIVQINASKSWFVLCQLRSWSKQKSDMLMWKLLEWGCKIGIGFVSSSNTSRENQQNAIPKKNLDSFMWSELYFGYKIPLIRFAESADWRWSLTIVTCNNSPSKSVRSERKRENLV